MYLLAGTKCIAIQYKLRSHHRIYSYPLLERINTTQRGNTNHFDQVMTTVRVLMSRRLHIRGNTVTEIPAPAYKIIVREVRVEGQVCVHTNNTVYFKLSFISRRIYDHIEFTFTTTIVFYLYYIVACGNILKGITLACEVYSTQYIERRIHPGNFILSGIRCRLRDPGFTIDHIAARRLRTRLEVSVERQYINCISHCFDTGDRTTIIFIRNKELVCTRSYSIQHPGEVCGRVRRTIVGYIKHRTGRDVGCCNGYIITLSICYRYIKGKCCCLCLTGFKLNTARCAWQQVAILGTRYRCRWCCIGTVR
ncbi:hypothetical protein D3C72_992990 [compost metagenome]